MFQCCQLKPTLYSSCVHTAGIDWPAAYIMQWYMDCYHYNPILFDAFVTDCLYNQYRASFCADDQCQQCTHVITAGIGQAAAYTILYCSVTTTPQCILMSLLTVVCTYRALTVLVLSIKEIECDVILVHGTRLNQWENRLKPHGGEWKVFESVQHWE